MSSTTSNFYDSDYQFDFDAGLNFAVAFTAYDNETEDILHPSYGNITFVKWSWGTQDDGDYFIK